VETYNSVSPLQRTPYSVYEVHTLRTSVQCLLGYDSICLFFNVLVIRVINQKGKEKILCAKLNLIPLVTSTHTRSTLANYSTSNTRPLLFLIQHLAKSRQTLKHKMSHREEAERISTNSQPGTHILFILFGRRCIGAQPQIFSHKLQKQKSGAQLKTSATPAKRSCETGAVGSCKLDLILMAGTYSNILGGIVSILEGCCVGFSKQMCTYMCLLFRTVSEIELFHCTVSKSLIRKRYCVLFLLCPKIYELKFCVSKIRF
jgi:hypothetical protein